MQEHHVSPFEMAEKLLYLIGRVHQTPIDDGDWRRHLMDGLCDTFDADCASFRELTRNQREDRMQVTDHILGGRRAPRVRPNPTVSAAQLHDPLLEQCHERLDDQRRTVTVCRHHEIDDGDWRTAPLAEHMLTPCGLEGYMLSLAHLPTRAWCVAIALFRRKGRPAFSSDDCAWLDMFHRQLEWLYRERCSDVDELTDQLSPRLRDVLYRLLAGDSAKQIAYRLELSQHTVRGYIKDIYRRLDVSSRGELLARCLKHRADQ